MHCAHCNTELQVQQVSRAIVTYSVDIFYDTDPMTVQWGGDEEVDEGTDEHQYFECILCGQRVTPEQEDTIYEALAA